MKNLTAACSVVVLGNYSSAQYHRRLPNPSKWKLEFHIHVGTVERHSVGNSCAYPTDKHQCKHNHYPHFPHGNGHGRCYCRSGCRQCRGPNHCQQSANSHHCQWHGNRLDNWWDCSGKRNADDECGCCSGDKLRCNPEECRNSEHKRHAHVQLRR